MTTPARWITMDLQQALQVVETHVPRGREGRRVCVICRTWVEQDPYTLVPQWPCDEVRRARTVVGRAQPLPENPPPTVPASVTRALRIPEWQRARTVTVPVKKEEKMAGNGYGYDVRDIDVEPKRTERGVVEVTITGRASTDEPLFHEMPADDARLLGLKLIRAADASERVGW